MRSVSPTCASSASAGWQQVKISSSRSSGNVAVSSIVSSDWSRSSRSSCSVFAASVRSRRMRSIARLRAVVISQPVGLAGTPSRGQRSAAIANASCAASSASSMSPQRADERRQHAAPVLAKDLLKHRRAAPRGPAAPRSRPVARSSCSSSAMARAPSRFSASTTMKPPRKSLLSTKGPSVSSVLPRSRRTVVADSTSWSRSQPVTSGRSRTSEYRRRDPTSFVFGSSDREPRCCRRSRARISRHLLPAGTGRSSCRRTAWPRDGHVLTFFACCPSGRPSVRHRVRTGRRAGHDEGGLMTDKPATKRSTRLGGRR